MPLDIVSIRSQFPALGIKDEGKARVYLDGPAGTQVPQRVVDAISGCLLNANANLGGDFPTSLAAEMHVDAARAALADIFGASDPQSIILGPNMTSLTKQMSASICATFAPGDTIVLSQMEHDANVSPWLQAAERFNLNVAWLPLDPATHMLDISGLPDLLKAGARLVAVGYASNVLGTINPVTEISTLARKHGALSYVDAVHYAPHGALDVDAVGCDMMVCSVYKFFGPHCAGLFMRPALIEALPAQPLRPAPQTGPDRFESGTLNHEGFAGITAAVDYLASLGNGTTRRQQLLSAFDAIKAHESALAWQLIDGLNAIDGITIRGITDRQHAAWRAPTVSFTHRHHTPAEITARLTTHNIFSWAGHSYALEPLRALGILNSGGVVRLGIAHYNTAAEVDQTLAALKACL